MFTCLSGFSTRPPNGGPPRGELYGGCRAGCRPRRVRSRVRRFRAVDAGQLRCTGALYAQHVPLFVRCSRQCCCAVSGAAYGTAGAVGRGSDRPILVVDHGSSGSDFLLTIGGAAAHPARPLPGGGGQQNPTLAGRCGLTAGPPRVWVGGIDAKSDLVSIGTGRRCWRSGVGQWAGSGFCCPTRPTIFN